MTSSAENGSPSDHLATEWQIYFVFALILLPLWRRFGLTVTVVAALALGIAPHWLFRGNLDEATFEFIGLFAFGMAGAIISFSTNTSELRLRNRIPWGSLTLFSLLPIAYFAKFRAPGDWPHLVLGNIILGLATMCLLIYCANSLLNTNTNSSPIVLRFLRAKPCVVLGSFSYSLYLIHAPVLALVTIGMRHLQLSTAGMVAAYFFGAVPLCVIAAYLFYLVFEKPFLTKSKKTISS